MTLSNHQPYFFPYLGYWQIINASDIFVIADNMQFSKKSYITRNSILLNNTSHTITLQTKSERYPSNINEVKVGENIEKLASTIHHAYSKAKFYKKVFPILEKILFYDEKNLAKYLGNSIEVLSDYLYINTKIIYESDLDVVYTEDPADGIINICKIFHADKYINAYGGRKLYKKEYFYKYDIELLFHKMKEIRYNQFKSHFVSNLSIIDVLMFNSPEEISEMLNEYELL